MDTFETLSRFTLQIWQGLRWQDVLDVIIVSFVLYKIFSFIKETRAVYLIRGLLLLVVIYFIADSFLKLKILTSVLQNAATLIIVAIPVLFQPELRRALSELGRGFSLFPTDRALKGQEFFDTIRILVSTAKALSHEKIGALIVIERRIGLNEFVETGKMLNAELSEALMHTIFYDGTPLHDGAIIVRGNKIVAAAVQLPLTDSKQSPAGTYWGMRHRAAMGMSEQSDAASLVVSEETGNISLILEGKTHRNLTEENLERQLMELFQVSTPENPDNIFTRALFARDKKEGDDKKDDKKEKKEASGWAQFIQKGTNKLFLNLRFIAVLMAVVWGLAVGLGNAPGPQLDLESQSKELLVPIQVQGNTDNMVIKLDPSQVTLKLSGRSERLKKLPLEELKVFINLQSTNTSEQIVPVGVSVPENVQLKEVSPRVINVKMIKLK